MTTDAITRPRRIRNEVLRRYHPVRERTYYALIARPANEWSMCSRSAAAALRITQVREVAYLLLGDQLVELVGGRSVLTVSLTEDAADLLRKVVLTWERQGVRCVERTGASTSKEKPVDPEAVSPIPPEDCEDELMWSAAYKMLADHVPVCQGSQRCDTHLLAGAGLATAMGEVRLGSDYWRALTAARRHVGRSADRLRFDDAWLSMPFERKSVASALARSDIGRLFHILHSTTRLISRRTKVSEQSVRLICNGKQRVRSNSHQMLERICDGLGIVRRGEASRDTPIQSGSGYRPRQPVSSGRTLRDDDRVGDR